MEVQKIAKVQKRNQLLNWLAGDKLQESHNQQSYKAYIVSIADIPRAK
jgi:hypothetical protein